MSQNKSNEIIDQFINLTYDEKVYLLDMLLFEENNKLQNKDNHKKSVYYNLLILLKNKITTEEQKRMYEYIYSHFNELTPERKEIIFKRFFVSVRDSYYRQKHEECEKYCKEHGHDFSQWEYIEKDYGYSHEHVFSSFDIHSSKEHFNYWIRKCNRCGYEEISYINPNKKKFFKKKQW